MLSAIVFARIGRESVPPRFGRAFGAHAGVSGDGQSRRLLGDVRIAGPAGKNLSILANHAGCDLIEAENEAAWLGLALQEHAVQCVPAALRTHSRSGFIEEAGDFLASHSKDQPRTAYLHALPKASSNGYFRLSRRSQDSSPPAISCWPRRAAAFQSSRALLLPRPYFLRAHAASVDRFRAASRPRSVQS